MTQSGGGQVLTVVVCAAGPASQVGELVKLARDRGWAVGIVTTPAAVPFLDVPALEALTGNPVRSEHRSPAGDRVRSLSPAKAVVVAPSSYNSICKLALGISDTYALDVVAEAIGRGTPVVMLPFINSAFAARLPFRRAVDSLRHEGVRVLFGPGQWEPHTPGTGGDFIASFPWAAALAAAESVVGG